MNKKGFTLVELLVVISIIALLLSILMPSLSRARQQAKILICSTRIKQNLYGATMAAHDDNGRLPKGGFQYDSINRDEAIAFRAEEYLNLCSYLADIGGPLDPTEEAEAEVMSEMAEKLFLSNTKKNFVCSELENKVWDLQGSGQYSIIRGQKEATMPYITRYGSAGWITRIGYCYLAGFDTDAWEEWPDYGKKWKSPMKTTDSGKLAVMADRYRIWPKEGWFVYTHGQGGEGQEAFDTSTPMDEVINSYDSYKCNVGRLDGSVETSRISELSPRHTSQKDNRPWDYTGSTGNFVFF